MNDILGPFSLGALILLGLALLWAVQLMYTNRRRRDSDILRPLLTAIGWTLVGIGAIAASLAMMYFFAILSWVVLAVVLVMAFVRYRRSERRALLWILSIAAEREIPLHEAAEAYGSERPDGVGLQAFALSKHLQAGSSFPWALWAAGLKFPDDVLLAADVGTEYNCLGTSLHDAVLHSNEYDATLRAAFEKLFYLVVVLHVCIFLLTFMMLKIAPVYAAMFGEFNLALPWATQMLIASSDWFIDYWFLLAPLQILLSILLLLGLMHYVGYAPRDFVLLGYFTRSRDGAQVLRMLAVSLSRQQPIEGMLRFLEYRFPKASARWRLRKANRKLAEGQHWADALWSSGLVRGAEVAVFKAAERAGNLQWALEESASRILHRSALRTRAWFNLLFPFVILLMGLTVMFVTVGFFLPLISLIQGLT